METYINLSNKTSTIGYTVIPSIDMIVQYPDGRKVKLMAKHYYPFSKEECKKCVFYSKSGETMSIIQNIIFI